MPDSLGSLFVDSNYIKGKIGETSLFHMFRDVAITQNLLDSKLLGSIVTTVTVSASVESNVPSFRPSCI